MSRLKQISALLLILSVSEIQATTVEWSGAAFTEDWNTAGNWAPTEIPTIYDEVNISASTITTTEDIAAELIVAYGNTVIEKYSTYSVILNLGYALTSLGVLTIDLHKIALNADTTINPNPDGSEIITESYVTGDYSVLVAGGGTWICAGPAIYTGGTTIGDTSASPGKVELYGSDGLLYSEGSVTLACSGSTLTLAASDIAQTLGSLTGVSGSSVVLGANNLTVSGNNTSTTFSGVISGSSGGNLIKEGSGTITLAGANTYTGTTTVSAGELNITGSITSDVTVDSSATLSGVGGTITGTVTVDSGGEISPGSSSASGTLTITETLTLDSGSIAYIPVTASSSGTDASKLVVDGAASVNGSQVEIVLADSTDYSADTFTVLQAGNISGTFSSITADYSNTYGITVTPFQLGSTVQFTITTDAPTLVVPLHGNAARVYDHIKDFYTTSSLSPLFQKIFRLQLLDPSGVLLEEALNMIQPARNAIATSVSSNTQFSAFNVISSRSATWRFWNALGQQKPQKEISLLEEELLVSNASQPFKKKALNSPSCVLNMGRPGDGYAVWFNPFGDISHVNTSAGAELPFHTYTGGGVLGTDICISNAGILEAAIGAARSSIVMNQGHQTVNYYLAALNGTYTIDNFFIEAGVMASYDQLENRRYINFLALNRTASSSHNMWQLTPQLSFGYLCWAASWGLEPFIAEDWVFNFEAKVAEHGAADLDSSIKARNSSLLRSAIGLNIYKDYTFTNKSVLLFRATGAYVNKVPFNLGKMAVSFFQVETGSFEVISFTKTQNLGMAGVEFVYGATNGMFGSIQYDGEFGQGYSANELQLQVGYSF